MLEQTYDSIDAIPEAHRDLFEERDGQFVLTGVEGMKTQADIDRLQLALKKERDSSSDAKAVAKKWGDLDYDEVMAKVDRVAELETTLGDNKAEQDKKVSDMADARVRTATGPLERKIKELAQKSEQLAEQNQMYKQAETRRVILDAVRKEAVKRGVTTSALPDVEILAEAVFEVAEDSNVITKQNGYGVSENLDPCGFFEHMQSKRSHWWGQTQGGGARGSSGTGGGPNPFDPQNGNITEQARIMQEDPARAKQLAKAAGVELG